MDNSISIPDAPNTTKNETNAATDIKSIADDSHHIGKNEQSLPNEPVTVDDHSSNEISIDEKEPSYSIESAQPLQKDMEQTDINFAGRDLVIIPSEHAPTTTTNCDIEMTEIIDLDDRNIQSRIHNLFKSTNHQTTTTTKNDNVFFQDYLFYVRIFVLILSTLLLFISGLFCASQLIDVKLKLFKPCEVAKTNEEIWEHSYKTYIDNKQVMNSASQHGLTVNGCITKRVISIQNSWYNEYITSDWKTFIPNAYIVFFGLLCIFLIIVIFYNLLTLILDIIAIKRNKLFTKSALYGEYMMEDNKNKKTDATQKEITVNTTGIKNKFVKFVKTLHGKYFADDTTGWILMKFVSELMEFIIQSQALFLYNGYNPLDPQNEKNVYLANKPQFIIAFSCILSFNGFGSGLLWLFYALMPNHCYGSLFTRCIFFVDKFSDLMYTLFPFYIILADDYVHEDSKGIKVLLGQLQFDTDLAFVATFIPLLFLSAKCLILITSSRHNMFDKSFKRWKEINPIKKNVTFGVTSTKQSEISWINKDDKHKSNKIKKLKQTLISFIATLFMVYAICILTYTIDFITSAEKYCASITESKFIRNTTLITLSETEKQIFTDYPELYLWEKCQYKVYPFVHHDAIPCQCRAFQIGTLNDLVLTANERKTHFNLTEEKMIGGVLNHWYMLERFGVTGSQAISLKSSMYKAVHMKIFFLGNVLLSSFESGMAAWKELEFLSFIHIQWATSKFPKQDFSSLESLRAVTFTNANIPDIDWICSLTQLEYIFIEYEMNIESLPRCLNHTQFSQLKAIWIDFTSIRQIPLTIFNFPNLLELSLFNAEIGFQELLDYNNINIAINDTFAINEWFNGNFILQNSTKYWLQYNPICDELEFLPLKIRDIVNAETCTHPCDQSNDYSQSELCLPRSVGDGHCDTACSDVSCAWDHGDCVQLCFAEQLTNCTYDLFTNDQCDQECNNEFCSFYAYGSDFIRPQQTFDQKQADLFHCNSTISLNVSIEECTMSSSIYIDKNLSPNQYDQCKQQWIGNRVCDDACRTYECWNDDIDCDDENVCRQGSLCWYVHVFFGILTSDFPSGQYKVNHSFACSTVWPKAVELTNSPDPGNCMGILKQEDYNNDGYTNYREFQTMLSYFEGLDTFSQVFSGIKEWGQTWMRQVNCSQCLEGNIGMENYNV